MSYEAKLSKTALADLERHQKAGDRALLKKLASLLEELLEHPRTGIGKPKQLRHTLKGLYSRRINDKHRLVYDIEEEVVTVLVLSAYGHYDDR